jgi:hypothetical protein
MERYRPAAILLEPALYRICILGYLDANWAEYCGDMTIEHANDPKFHAITIMTGRLIDQSALIGVLNSLHDLGCLIMSVEFVVAE